MPDITFEVGGVSKFTENPKQVYRHAACPIFDISRKQLASGYGMLLEQVVWDLGLTASVLAVAAPYAR